MHGTPGSLEDILARNGEEFVQACYRAILQRDADESGLAHHLDVLAKGASKVAIAGGLAGSDEAISRGVSHTRIAIRARQMAMREKNSLPRIVTSSPLLLALVEKAAFRAKAKRYHERMPGSGDEAEVVLPKPVIIERISPSVWRDRYSTMAANKPSFWFDLTTALQWTGGVVGIVRAELEMASGLSKVHGNVRFSMQVDQGFVEIPHSEIEWLLKADNVADAYMRFFGRYRDSEDAPRFIRIQAPDINGFFHPYSAGDAIFSVGWMDSQKENYFSLLKVELPSIHLAYLVYDTILLGENTRHFYNPIGSDQFERYLKWISHNCDFILYGGETARKDTESYQQAKGWPTPPGKAIMFGTDIVKLSDDTDADALLREVGVTGPFIMTVGSIEPRKNHETLYRAYLLATEIAQKPLPQLVICGKPMWRVDDLVDTLARDPRLEGRVLCCTPTDTQLAALYSNCQFTLLPSLYEGWSLTLPESLGQGKFCLAADTPPLKEIGRDLIDYVEPFDVRGWAEKIVEYSECTAKLRSREDRIVSEWPTMRWVDSAQMAFDYLDTARRTIAPQHPRTEGLHDPLGWRPPTIWMDLTLSFLEWNGSVNGIVRAELMYARLLKKLAPNTRFFAYESGHFFEIADDFLTWLHTDGDLSQAYDWFHVFWRQHEEAGTGYRSVLRSGEATTDNPAYLKDFAPNSLLFFAGIDFGSYNAEGQAVLNRIQQIERHIKPDTNVLRTQLIYDFTPLLYPHLHMAQTVQGYLPFIDYVSNHFDYIIYGGRTAQRDGRVIQQEKGWRTPPSDFIEFGSDINPAMKKDRAFHSEKDGNTLEALGITSDYVMTIGTIEPRKNHEALYKAYLMMLQGNMLDTPLQMVFVGKKGWKSDDLLANIEADGRVRGKILMLTPGDEELDTLYRNCRFTLLPSFYEGWSLTLPESLSYGKFCLVSDVDPLRETGGDLVEYIHPLDTLRWAERIAHYANNPFEVQTWESRIKAGWEPRTWQSSAGMLIELLWKAHRNAYDALLADQSR